MKPGPRVVACLTLLLALSLQGSRGARAANPPEAPRWSAVSYLTQRKAIGLSWRRVPGAQSYVVLRMGPGETEERRIAQTSGLQHVDATVEYGAEYTYRVGAEFPEGVIALSEAAAVTAMEKEKIPPAAPRWMDLQLQKAGPRGVGFAVSLLWNRMPDVLAYNVQRRAGTEGEFQSLTTVREPQYLDGDVVPGETYAYRLTALSMSMIEGRPSEERQAAIPKQVEVEKGAAEPLNEIRVVGTRLVSLVTGDQRVPLRAPVDMVIGPDDRVYVVDNQAPGVLVFSAGGEFLKMFGQATPGGAGGLVSPYGIAADRDGQIWVTDRKKDSEVIAFDLSGTRVFSFVFNQQPKPETLELLDARTRGEKPFALDVDLLSNGDLVLTDNTFDRVCRYDRSGHYLSEFGLPGSQPGRLNRPSKIAVDNRDRIFVLDSQNRKVQVFGADGDFLFDLGRAKTIVGSFLGLSGVTFLDAETVCVADSPMGTIQAFSSKDGGYRYHFGAEDRATDPTRSRAVWDIVTPSGIVYQAGYRRLWLGMPMIHSLAIREVIE